MKNKRIYDPESEQMITTAGLCKDIEYIKTEITEIKVKMLKGGGDLAQ